MKLQTLSALSLKAHQQNEIILLPSLKTVPVFKENLSLKTFDVLTHFGLHPSQVQGFLKEQFL